MINSQHRPHDPAEHDHVHGDGCGHRAVPHDDHLDYLHNGHWHASMTATTTSTPTWTTEVHGGTRRSTQPEAACRSSRISATSGSRPRPSHGDRHWQTLCPNALLVVGALSHSGKWCGVLAEARDQPQLIDAQHQVVVRLGGLSRVWRFDRMATVVHPGSGEACELPN